MEIDLENEDKEDLETIHLLSEVGESSSTLKALPEKSKARYLITYEKFNEWRRENHIQVLNEEELLKYFLFKARNLKSSSLWSEYSMLKTTLHLNDNLDISNMRRLLNFLKKKAIGYKPKKANVFTKEQVNEFLHKAPDKKYLMMKVALIFGIAGACRSRELTYLTINDVKDFGDMLIITIPDTKLKRTFTIHAEDDSFLLNIYRRYISLRPPNMSLKRFFINYRLGKCSKQPVGIHVISKIPYHVAVFLQLPNPEAYTGHSYRRSSSNTFVGNCLIQRQKQDSEVVSSTVDRCNEIIKNDPDLVNSLVSENLADDRDLSNDIDMCCDVHNHDYSNPCEVTSANKTVEESESDNDIKPDIIHKEIESKDTSDLSDKKCNIVIKNCTGCTINIHFS